ncbi:MAG: FAD-binding oxidoreductase [Bacteriovoracaceae bacterium]|nr:FAD-binding oxidoreductase [Bacteriovoracaceae bacterium]
MGIEIMTRLLVIGEGIAAQAFLNSLIHEDIVDKFTSITQLSHSELAPLTSWNSTAIAALRGTRRGMSPLGDELVDMWEESNQAYTQEKWKGVYPIELHSWIYSDKSDRRYGHLPKVEKSFFECKIKPRGISTERAWVIDPKVFLQNITTPKNLVKKKSLVTSLVQGEKCWRVETLDKEVFEADIVVLASGHWAQWMQEYYAGSPLEGLKPYQGSYYQWENVSFGERGFSVIIEGSNFIYQAENKRLILGATSLNGVDHFIADKVGLKKIYDHFQSYADVNLPSIQESQIHTGIRSQTKGRRPWAGKLQNNLYAIGGLYKTGWVSSIPLARQLAKSLFSSDQ